MHFRSACYRNPHFETAGRPGHDPVQRLGPMPPAKAHSVRADLPAASYGRVDDRVLAASIRGGFGHADDPLGLLGQQCKATGPMPSMDKDGARSSTGPADRAEQGGEFCGKDQHGRDSRDVGVYCRSYGRNPGPATGP